MQYLSNFSLKAYNTFGVDVKAHRFVSVNSLEGLKKVLQENKQLFLLGGGSNMLLTKDIAETVVHINLKGKTTQNKTENTIEVTVMAGENWHEFVLWCIHHNYGGLENLSLIPGNVGTCPIQNIGAYGTEVKDTITKVTVLNIATLEVETLSNVACNFGYRNSIFKTSAKGKYIIISVTFQLTTKQHALNTSYGAIQQQLEKIANPTIKDVSNAVIAIRNSKLPNPKELGNGGSFFKNPIISKTLYQNICLKHQDVPCYTVSEDLVKIPAGWLIEKAGFKGKSYQNVGVHHQQALVLVNYGNATGKEVYELAKKIQKKIKKYFAIFLEIEVNVY